MSKSLGNFFTVRDLLDRGVPGEVIRFVFLSTHYRKPMDWTAKKAEEAQGTLSDWHELTLGLEPTNPASFEPDQKLVEVLSDDLNTHLALVRLRAMRSNPQQLLDNARFLGFLGDEARSDYLQRRLGFSFGSGDDLLAARMDMLLDSMRVKLIALREEARETKDFSEVDRLKAALVAAGVEVRMSKDEVELIPGAGCDPAKLEALK
jgi:cysteinyl-tRNA synthetase